VQATDGLPNQAHKFFKALVLRAAFSLFVMLLMLGIMPRTTSWQLAAASLHYPVQ